MPIRLASLTVLVLAFAAHAHAQQFVSFDVVANASGVVDPAVPGAAAFAGFPTPGDENPNVQQANGTRWLFSTGGRGPYAEFLERVLRNENADRAFPYDYEARFTGSSTALRSFQEGGTMTIPFEIWNIGVGTPDDPSDDVRMIPLILDVDLDGTYNLSTLDSPISGADNDPETDWVYWYEPTDMTAGEAGYLAWEASGGDVSLLGSEVFARTTFVGWNLGSAPPYSAETPEAGTVFRILGSGFVPATAELDGDRSPLALEVHPNPTRGHAAVPFRLAAPGEIQLRVVNVLGQQVAALASGTHSAGDHQASFDTSRLSAGVYVVVLEAEGAVATQRLTVVR